MAAKKHRGRTYQSKKRMKVPSRDYLLASELQEWVRWRLLTVFGAELATQLYLPATTFTYLWLEVQHCSTGTAGKRNGGSQSQPPPLCIILIIAMLNSEGLMRIFMNFDGRRVSCYSRFFLSGSCVFATKTNFSSLCSQGSVNWIRVNLSRVRLAPLVVGGMFAVDPQLLGKLFFTASMS